MRVLIAPDKFKGSLTAQQVCDAIASGLRDYDSSLDIKSIPLADGGDGTSFILTSFSQGECISVSVTDPLFRKIEASYGISPDRKIAFIEIASASGLMLLEENERNPLFTTSFGTGELIRHALDQGVEKIIIGLGGSATNDAGIGAAEALGVKFFDKNNQRLPPIGENLQHIHTIDTSAIHNRLKSGQSIILCDVNNPLHGVNGAAYVYAPQKGADEQAVKLLDYGLKNIDEKLLALGHSNDYPGAGAAGGFSVMMRVIMNTSLRSGFEFVSDFVDLEEAVKNTDVVITGEGSIDRQTLSGKVVMGVTSLGRKYGKPVVAIAGISAIDRQELKEIGIAALITLADQTKNIENAIENAFTLLKSRSKTDLGPLLKGIQN